MRAVLLAVGAALLASQAIALDEYNRKAFDYPIRVERVNAYDANRQLFECTGNTRFMLLARKGWTSISSFGKSSTGLCTILTGGIWEDEYSRAEIVGEDNAEIDHLVPLREAWESGAWKWTHDQRQTFANDIDNLRITSRAVNNLKSGRNLAELDRWAPPRLDKCEFSKSYVKVKLAYNMSFTKGEIKYLSDNLDKCWVPGVFNRSRIFGLSVKNQVQVR